MLIYFVMQHHLRRGTAYLKRCIVAQPDMKTGQTSVAISLTVDVFLGNGSHLYCLHAVLSIKVLPSVF